MLNAIYETLGLSVLEDKPIVKGISHKVKVSPRQTLSFMTIVLVVLSISPRFGQFFSDLFLVVFPGMETLKSLNLHDTHTTNRLFYFWITFSFTLLCRPVLNWLSRGLPFSHLWTVAFLVALWLPQTAEKLNFGERVILPLYVSACRLATQLHPQFLEPKLKAKSE